MIPLGKAVGIKLFADGALVVGLSEGDPCPAKDCGLKEGDLILSMGDTKITSTEQVRALLQDNGCEPLVMTVRRSSRTLTVTAVPVQGVDGAWQLGAWIRDSMAGIGTLTYYDPATGSYGALGHGITDVDTAKLMPLASGSIMETTVKAVKKGVKGDPGELKGDFSVQRDVGTVSINSDGGIFGTVADPDFLQAGTPVPVATGAGRRVPGGDRPGVPRQPVHPQPAAPRDGPAAAGYHRRHRTGHERQPHPPERTDRGRCDPCTAERPRTGLRYSHGEYAGHGGIKGGYAYAVSAHQGHHPRTA